MEISKVGLKNAISEEKWESGLEKFILKIFFEYLLINPKEHKIVICEELTMSVPFKQALSTLFLKQFGVPSILFVDSSLSSLLPLGYLLLLFFFFFLIIFFFKKKKKKKKVKKKI